MRRVPGNPRSASAAGGVTISIDEGVIDSSAVKGLGALETHSGEPFLSPLIDQFFGEAPRRLSDVESALARGDARAIELNAHSIKGSAAMLGAVQVAVLAASIELAAKSGKLDALDGVAQRLREAIERAEPMMRKVAIAATREARRKRDERAMSADFAIRHTLPEAPDSADARTRGAPPPPRVFADKELLGGVYEIEGVLGEGGMGQVYAAVDRLMNRKVAIKVSWRGVDPSLLRREAEALAAVRHPGVVTVYAMGAHGDVPYLVMERLSGMTLSSYLDHRRAAGDPPSVDEATDFLIAVGDALAAVHRAGIAHRDVKPENVLLAPGDRVMLMDFGLVTQERQAGANPDAGGTPVYMAPEVISREVRAGAAHLTDLYSFGVLAFELLTGEAPFASGSVAHILHDHLATPVPSLRDRRPEASEALEALVTSLLSKDPNDRPSTADEVLWQLRRIRRGDGRGATARRIVVVDDDMAMTKLMAACARSIAPDAKIEMASDATNALRLLRDGGATLMVLDLSMPGMSGIELCMYLRGAPLAEPCAIIAVSGTARTDDQELLRRLGVARFVPKGESFLPRLAEALRYTLGGV
jgi:CheY-like chemotaxis protein